MAQRVSFTLSHTFLLTFMPLPPQRWPCFDWCFAPANYRLFHRQQGLPPLGPFPDGLPLGAVNKLSFARPRFFFAGRNFQLACFSERVIWRFVDSLFRLFGRFQQRAFFLPLPYGRCRRPLSPQLTPGNSKPVPSECLDWTLVLSLCFSWPAKEPEGVIPRLQGTGAILRSLKHFLFGPPLPCVSGCNIK